MTNAGRLLKVKGKQRLEASPKMASAVKQPVGEVGSWPVRKSASQQVTKATTPQVGQPETLEKREAVPRPETTVQRLMRVKQRRREEG
jgi:hypothetical protein